MTISTKIMHMHLGYKYAGTRVRVVQGNYLALGKNYVIIDSSKKKSRFVSHVYLSEISSRNGVIFSVATHIGENDIVCNFLCNS